MSTVSDLLVLLLLLLLSCRGGETDEGAVDEGVETVEVDEDVSPLG